MSWPQQVPHGWTKGEPLYHWGTGPRYGLSRQNTTDPFKEATVKRDDVAVITFDSHADATAFLKWWRA